MIRSWSCPICGGLLPGFRLYGKEVYEQCLLPGVGACNCGEADRLRAKFEAIFSPSRVVALARFRAAAKEEGLEVV